MVIRSTPLRRAYLAATGPRSLTASASQAGRPACHRSCCHPSASTARPRPPPRPRQAVEETDDDDESIHDEVRIRYAAAAPHSGGCCSGDPETIGAELYSARSGRGCPTPRSSPPSAAATRRRSPSCARARPSWTSAPAAASTSSSRRKRVGPSGRAIGVDGPTRCWRSPEQRRRGRRLERRVPQGHDRGAPAPTNRSTSSSATASSTSRPTSRPCSARSRESSGPAAASA